MKQKEPRSAEAEVFRFNVRGKVPRVFRGVVTFR
jgi:hypothetical protein